MAYTTLPEFYIPIKNFRAGHILLIAEEESSATEGLDYKLEAIAEGSRIPQTIVEGTLAQAAIAAGGPDASVVLGEFTDDTYGWIGVKLSVKVPAGSVTYSAYLVTKP